MTRCSMLAVSILLTLSGMVSSTIAYAAPQYKDAAASFKTTTCSVPCDKPQVSNWYLWRGENRIETRIDSNEVGEIWRRDSKGRISFVYVEPAYKRGIEYNDTDLRMVNHKISWDRLASIVSPVELKKLALTGELEIFGYKAQRYNGKVDNRMVEVIWIPDLQMAAKVVSSYPDRQVTNELKSFLGDHAAVSATSEEELANYQLVDFADLGDMETNETMAWLKKVDTAPGLDHHDH